MSATLQPDSDAALDFLQKFHGDGPYLLTAIGNNGAIISEEVDARNLRGWLQSWNSAKRRNIYHTHAALHAFDARTREKPSREDVHSINFLHADLDARRDETTEEAIERTCSLLATRLPNGVPPPTVVVLSGGGHQPYWKLEKPIVIGGDLAKADDAALYNKALEIALGGDHCHNVERLLRVPGTINWPSEKKQRKGRVPVLARLVQYDASRVYPLSAFAKASASSPSASAPVPAAAERRGAAAPSPVVDRRYTSDELRALGLSDRLLHIAVNGRHDLEPKEGDSSRSVWLFDFVCNALRAGLGEDVVLSVITDPGFAISESVLELGSRAEKYALKQITTAKEQIVDPWLRELNARHAVISNLGGRTRVLEEVFDIALGRSRLTKQSFDDFRNRYMNKYIEVGVDKHGKPVKRPVGAWWLGHPLRRQVRSVVFVPGQETPDDYNLWQGFAVDPAPGDCSLFLEHVRENICGGDAALNEYLLSWMARAVRTPDRPGEVAVVMRGARGVGKSVFARHLGKLFGRHFLHVSNPAHLVGNFNSHLRDVVVLFADEAFAAGDKRHASMLKTLVTEDTITIEAKGVDAEAAANCVHLIMASNDEHVVPAGPDERRFLVLDVGEGRKQDSKFFGAMKEQMESGGYAALLHVLQTRDIADFDVRAFPRTKALQEQKMLSLSAEDQFLMHVLDEAELPGPRPRNRRAPPGTVLSVWNIGTTRGLLEQMRASSPRLRNESDQRLTAFLKARGCKKYLRNGESGWTFPPLGEARAAFEKRHGPVKWTTEATAWPSEVSDEMPF